MYKFLALITILLVNQISHALSYDKLPEKITNPLLKNIVESTVVLYQKGTRFGFTNFCSGVVIEHKGRYLVQTAAHCISTTEQCESTYFVRKYYSSFYGQSGVDYPEMDIVSTGFAIQHQCIKPIFIDQQLDLAYLLIDEPMNSPLKNDELASIPFDSIATSSSPKESVFLVGHPGGYRMTLSSDCVTIGFGTRSDEAFATFKVQHDCLSIGGNSGGPLIRASDFKMVGVHIEGEQLRNYNGPFDEYFDKLRVLKLKKWAVYLPTIKDTISRALDGNSPKGFLSATKMDFKPFGCRAFFRGRPDNIITESAAYVRIFSRMANLLQINGVCKNPQVSHRTIIFVIRLNTNGNGDEDSLYNLNENISDEKLWHLMSSNI